MKTPRRISFFLFLAIFVSCHNLKTVNGEERKMELTQADRAEFVNAHNNLRNMFNLKPVASNILRMYWDADLELMAKRWALKCTFSHGQSVYTNTKFADKTPLGQNLYVSAGSKPNLTLITLVWYNEYRDYNYDTLGCTPNKMCGHYTQVVWHNTKYVGCWVTFCDKVASFTPPNAQNVVCNYAPAGNYVGEKPYKAGENCSACPATEPVCYKNLCDSATKCAAVTECKASGEDCLCDEAYYKDKAALAGGLIVKASRLPLVITAVLILIVNFHSNHLRVDISN